MYPVQFFNLVLTHMYVNFASVPGGYLALRLHECSISFYMILVLCNLVSRECDTITVTQYSSPAIGPLDQAHS